MGVYTLGPPEDLVLLLQRTFSIRDFIETGTYEGTTAAWAADRFPNVVTIELSPALHEAAARRHAAKRNVVFRFGDSERLLPGLVASLTQPALFWLDAHWSGGVTAGAERECPLLGELAIIDRAPLTHFLLIDDARLFMAPPPLPHQADRWPTIWTIRDHLARKNRYVCVFQDVIIAVPWGARDVVIQYCQSRW
jgi:hypothetical protein